MSEPVKFSRKPELQRTTMVVSWITDPVGLGESVTGYLNTRLTNEPFCQIEPSDFFQLEGVHIENDVIQFPESAFFAGARKDLVIFRSTPPRFDWHRFLTMVLDVAQQQCDVAELYVVGGMVSLVPHVAARELLGNFGTQEVKDSLASYNISFTWNYETPPGQRPTLNSYLLWAAQQRNIPSVALWVPIPFYLTGSGDPKAQVRILEFFNRKLNLCMSFDDLDEEVRKQNSAITRAREESEEINEFISKIERGETLSAEDSQKLAAGIDKALSGGRP